MKSGTGIGTGVYRQPQWKTFSTPRHRPRRAKPSHVLLDSSVDCGTETRDGWRWYVVRGLNIDGALRAT